jgi:hypothetical protein
MNQMLHGFADELVKIAGVGKLIPYSAADPMIEIIKQQNIEQDKKDYIRSAIAGAALAPVASIASRGLGRFMKNRAIRSAMSQVDGPARQALEQQLRSGPLVGRVRAYPQGVEPLVTTPDIATDAIMGALGGTALEALKKKIQGEK